MLKYEWLDVVCTSLTETSSVVISLRVVVAFLGRHPGKSVFCKSYSQENPTCLSIIWKCAVSIVGISQEAKVIHKYGRGKLHVLGHGEQIALENYI